MSNVLPFNRDQGSPEERAHIDVTACLDGYRVWIGDRRFHDFKTLTAAARVASALMTLDNYGLVNSPTLLAAE